MKKLVCLLALVTLLTVVSAQDYLQEIEIIKQVQMITKDVSWTPGVTSVARLSYAERAKLCGLIITEAPQKNLAQPQSYFSARGAVDLRQDGLVSKVQNQGSCGSCWAFAMTACMENACLKEGYSLDLSEQALVSCCKDSCSGCSGGVIGPVANYLKGKGQCLETEFKYTAANGTCKTYTAKAVATGYGTFSNIYDMKKALDGGHAVDFGFKVYSDFMYYSGGIYKYTTGTYQGGHAVCAVGYSDAGQYWIVKNSWGTGWGESGYFRFDYDSCDKLTAQYLGYSTLRPAYISGASVK